MGLDNVKHVVLILSGKGGVGKSSVTLQLALSLSRLGQNVGILDIDLTGPSIPRLLGLEDKKVTQAPGGWLPVKVHDAVTKENGYTGHRAETNGGSLPAESRGSLHALSLAFLLPSRDSAVIWRGPKKTAMIRQFISDCMWPPGTDYLLIDTPPGTSDEHIAVVEELHKLAMTPGGNKLSGAVVVTTPQAVATSDVRKELNFCVKTSVPVIGVVENMAGYMCPCCGEISNVFSKGGGELMARECDVPFLGSVPIDTEFGSLVEGVVRGDEDADENQTAVRHSRLLVERYVTDCKLAATFQSLARSVMTTVNG